MKITDYQRDLPKLNKELATLPQMRQRNEELISQVNRIQTKLVTNFNVTQVFNEQAGPLPVSGRFHSNGGSLLLFLAATAYHGTAGAVMQVDVLVDGAIRVSLKGYTNEATSHKALAMNAFFLTGIPAGTHIVKFQVAGATLTDVNDRYNVTVVELPF